MIRSMTGYGKSAVQLSRYNLTVELKTLNSKQLDLNLRLPQFLRDKEPDIRSVISRKLERGKVDLTIFAEASGEQSPITVNRELANRYYSEFTALAREFGTEPVDLLSLIIRMPDVVGNTREEVDESEWDSIMECIGDALSKADVFRAEEGSVLENDMLQRVQSILRHMEAISPFEKRRTTLIREKLLREFQKLNEESSSLPADNNRFEQELIYYFEKLDITEEKVRLLRHCELFLGTLGDEASQGKKLGFIVQEMGREINTIGSKASDADIQHIVVLMKDELEKIREQLGNIL